MLDPLLLRKDLDGVVARLLTRKNPQPFLDVPAFQALESERKTIQTRTEELQAQRNSASKQIGQRKAKGESADDLMAQVASIKDELDA
ncbi:MAG: serine--tRNA ligase, partial [Ottowia sp.]|nr:serine--tRNA ligase [Ottowia sp.]